MNGWTDFYALLAFPSQLGDDSNTDRYIPTKVLDGSVMVGAGYNLAGSITSTGDLLAWGYINSRLPTRYLLPAGLRVAKVAFGLDNLCVLTTVGTIYCSGEDKALEHLLNLCKKPHCLSL